MENLKLFKDLQSLSLSLAELCKNLVVTTTKNRDFYLAISGGSTPRQLFQTLARAQFSDLIPWHKLHIFWVDERCVPMDHPDSNYLLAKQALFDHINLPPDNIHAIRGAAEPNMEALRYAEDVKSSLPKGENGLPRFDLILLGLGGDGHTASLFPTGEAFKPGSENLLCRVAEHPGSRQKRISMNLPLLNGAAEVVFMVSGSEKSGVVADIFLQRDGFNNYPAALVSPESGKLTWYLDHGAAQLLHLG
ncbi:MAG: 6-phosphogluconolactonase [Magnetococcales bacterium]|nr:6-phosphogluconolactonase [Magnetococcales bacterium]